MGYQQTFAVSAAGMDIERLRLDVAALNLAQANTALGSGESATRPMRVVARSAVPGAHASGAGGFAGQVNRLLTAPAATLEASDQAPRRVLEPGHPMADSQGYVSYPAVDTTVEMMTLMGAVRAYEANVAAMNASRTMALKALDIGGGQ
jgi:flagellar basal-body rod protein FlgC